MKFPKLDSLKSSMKRRSRQEKIKLISKCAESFLGIKEGRFSNLSPISIERQIVGEYLYKEAARLGLLPNFLELEVFKPNSLLDLSRNDRKFLKGFKRPSKVNLPFFQNGSNLFIGENSDLGIDLTVSKGTHNCQQYIDMFSLFFSTWYDTNNVSMEERTTISNRGIHFSLRSYHELAQVILPWLTPNQCASVFFHGMYKDEKANNLVSIIQNWHNTMHEVFVARDRRGEYLVAPTIPSEELNKLIPKYLRGSSFHHSQTVFSLRIDSVTPYYTKRKNERREGLNSYCAMMKPLLKARHNQTLFSANNVIGFKAGSKVHKPIILLDRGVSSEDVFRNESEVFEYCRLVYRTHGIEDYLPHLSLIKKAS